MDQRYQEQRGGQKTHVVQKKRWTSIDSGPGSGAVCVQGALRPISLEVGTKPLCTKGPEGGVPIEEVGTRQKSEKARMSMSEGSRSLRKKLRHFARSATKAFGAQYAAWCRMEKGIAWNAE